MVEGELASMPSAERDLVLQGVAGVLEETDFTDAVLFDANLDESALADLAEPATRRTLERLAAWPRFRRVGVESAQVSASTTPSTRSRFSRRSWVTRSSSEPARPGSGNAPGCSPAARVALPPPVPWNETRPA